MSGTNLFDLSGRVAVVTGASSGIGRSIALAFADAGAAMRSAVLAAARQVCRAISPIAGRSGNAEIERANPSVRPIYSCPPPEPTAENRFLM